MNSSIHPRFSTIEGENMSFDQQPPPIHHAVQTYQPTNVSGPINDELPDNLPMPNFDNGRPLSELFLDVAAELGVPFDTNVMGDGQQKILLRPTQDVDFDPTNHRPATAASADTYQKAQTMFTDFDGTHYAPTIQEDGEQVEDTRPGSSSMLRSPPKIDRSIPPPEDGMVFYPAPVPKTLMLPQRLSRALPAAEQARRRSHMLNALPNDARKSAIWLNKHKSVTDLHAAETEEDVRRIKQRMSTLPPQLRASMFFENPSQLQEVEIKDTSAVATLEDLLDASTIAPVSAFTDHPFAGKSGPNIYKSEGAHKRTGSKGTPPKKHKRASSALGFRLSSMSSSNALNDVPKVKKKSSRAFSLGTRLDDYAAPDEGEITTRPGTSSGVIPSVQVDGADGEEDQSSEEEPDFDMPSDEDEEFERVGPPTTLLAELQYRKAAQKQRNRTALSAFPNGMHSTLLEMDAVAQVQRKKRQNARVTLAWEDPDRLKGGQNAVDDDDVPLGVILASGKKTKPEQEWDQPMGLIQLRELEDNEPLAARRARLRGSEMFGQRPPSHFRSLSGTPMLQVNGDAMIEDEQPEETLAQRIRRLKTQSATPSSDGARPQSQAPSEELLAQQVGAADASKEEVPEVDEEEETLGQRRARLQREASRQSQMTLPMEGPSPIASPQEKPVRPALRTSTSMADLLHNVPMGATRRVSDQKLLSSLPQHSLLKQSEDRKAAHAEMMAGVRNAHRTPSGHFGSQPLLDMTNVDANRHGIPNNNGYRSSTYNNIYAGVGQAAQTNQSMMDLRQSMAIIAQQNQMALQMMATHNQMGGGGPQGTNMAMMMDPRMGMMQQQQHPMMMMQQQAPVLPLNPHMSMQMPMAGSPYMNNSPYEQQAHMGAYGAGVNASTPNLMAGGPALSMMGGNGMAYQQRHVSMGGMMSPAQAMAGAAQDDIGYVDINTQARIDAWRQDVQM